MGQNQMSEERRYYVYRIDDLDGVPVYVGKGGGDPSRARHLRKRNPAITALIKAGLTRECLLPTDIT